MARWLLIPTAVLTLLAGLLPLATAMLASVHGVQAGLADPALAPTLRVAAQGAAAAAVLAVPLGLAGALAVWQAAGWVRMAVAALAVLVVIVPASGFVTLRFLAPPNATAAMEFGCTVARGAALALLVLRVGLQRVPPGLRRAAQLAGATPFQAWRHAVLAPLRPYLLGAALAAVAVALADGPADQILGAHLDLAEAWIAPAALLLVAGSLAALATLLRRRTA